MKNLLVGCFTIALFGASPGYSQIVIQHIGANDPETEGFVINNFIGGPEIGPVFDDLGRDAWMIKTKSPQEGFEYGYILTAQEEADALAHGWELSANVRFVNVSESLNAQSLVFHTGSEVFWFLFSTDLNDILRVSDRMGSIYHLEESEGGYHNYSFRYDPLTEVAGLWVDSVDTGLELLPWSSTTKSQLRLLTGEGPDHAHWNEITFRIIPEPATVALLAGLGALLIAGSVRWRKRRFGRT